MWGGRAFSALLDLALLLIQGSHMERIGRKRWDCSRGLISIAGDLVGGYSRIPVADRRIIRESEEVYEAGFLEVGVRGSCSYIVLC